jgi:hypothetical protein
MAGRRRKRELIATLQAEHAEKDSYTSQSLGATACESHDAYFGLVFFLIQMGGSVVVFHPPTFIGLFFFFGWTSDTSADRPNFRCIFGSRQPQERGPDG